MSRIDCFVRKGCNCISPVKLVVFIKLFIFCGFFLCIFSKLALFLLIHLVVWEFFQPFFSIFFRLYRNWKEALLPLCVLVFSCKFSLGFLID